MKSFKIPLAMLAATVQICFALVVLGTIIAAPVAFLRASQEAAAFNRFTTGPRATTWDAVWLELRVEAQR
jgi:ABC-type phosphate/phosphonate transport system permease subunit